jgi:hypothetical protein
MRVILASDLDGDMIYSLFKPVIEKGVLEFDHSYPWGMLFSLSYQLHISLNYALVGRQFFVS